MFVTPALAQTAGGAAAAGGPPAFLQFVPLLLMGLIFYFFLILPNQRRQKAHREKLAAVKKGDQVITWRGLLGKAVKVTEDEVEIELGANVRVRALKTTLSDVIPLGSSKPAND